MFVEVAEHAPGEPQLRAKEDLDRLAIHVSSGVSSVALARTLRGAQVGEMDGGHAWLEISWLRSAAGERDREWQEAFVGMLERADTHGWLSEDRRRVRAHVEWERSDGV